MTFCIAVFRSRTHTIGFIRYMRAQGIDVSAINTPTQIKMGCGISAKMPMGYVKFSEQVILALGYSSFKGFYLVEEYNNSKNITKI